jgi:hypothetical protein
MPATTRLWTRTGLRRGPLNRRIDRIDRIEAWARVALLVLFVIVTPPVAWSVGAAVAHAASQEQRVQELDRHPVTARLVQDAPVPAVTTGGVVVTQTLATAEWTEPDGSTHRAMVKAAPGARAGSAQTVWTDAAGTVVPAPPSRSDTLASICGAVFLVTVLIGAVTAAANTILHRRFTRHRLDQWDQEWQQVGPVWGPPQ